MSTLYDKERDNFGNTFSPYGVQPYMFQNSPNVRGSPNGVHAQLTPFQSHSPSSPSLNNPYYGTNNANQGRFPVQMNMSQKMPASSSALSHIQHQNVMSTPISSTGLGSPLAINVTAPVDLSSAYGSVSTPPSKHYQKQLTQYQITRQCGSPHYHARTAAAAAKIAANLQNSSSSAVTITDPSNPARTINVSKSKPKDPSTPAEGNPASVDNDKSDQPWTSMDMGGMGLKTISVSLYQNFEFLTTLYLNHNNFTELRPEIGRLKQLELLDLSANKLASIPPELGMLVKLKELLLFDNNLSTVPNELGSLYHLETLGLEGNPLQEPYKGLLVKEGTKALISFLKDSCPVPMPPPEREWIPIEGSAMDDSKEKFTVFCYNILSERCATTQMYGYTPSWALAWDYRKENILQEVLSYNADIVCLQEVELSQYEDYFRDELKQSADYDSIYWPKSRAKTMSEKERRCVDGCATFFKASKFECIDKHLIEFSQAVLQSPDFERTDDVYNRMMTKDHIAVFALLEHKETGTRLILANTHLHWDPAFADVKLIQTAMLINEVTRLESKWSKLNKDKTNNGKLPIIIAGDFNSVTGSGVYDYVSKGSVSADHEDLQDHDYGSFTASGLSHNLSLRSAYANGVELPFTNFVPGFEGVIDYIWYTTSSLSVSGLLGPVDKSYLGRIVGFPHAHYPSDHVCILAEFKLRSKPETREAKF